jgi:hypothetical protein
VGEFGGIANGKEKWALIAAKVDDKDRAACYNHHKLLQQREAEAPSPSAADRGTGGGGGNGGSRRRETASTARGGAAKAS